jgi:NitT/TauT family transport system substrate-binding protein
LNSGPLQRKKMKASFALLATLLLIAASGIHAQQKPVIMRVGYFPNITHAQALVGRAGGQFEKAVGPGVQIEWKAFNAGPSAIEALFANAIDLTYVGPNPTVTGYVRSQGDAVRVIAGAASGGASLVVRQGAGIQKTSDFHGKKVATPQQGNTQDVALRA